MPFIDCRNKLVLDYDAPAVQNRIVGIAGRKGSGKSTVNREILMYTRRLFLFDTMAEHNWIPNQFTDLSEAINFIWEHAPQQADFVASYIPEGSTKGQLERDFDAMSNAIYENGNITFVVEEIPMMTNPNYAPEPYDRLIRLGRHHCINLGYTAQRLGECPRRLTAATDIFVLFQTTEPRDLDAIAERSSPEVADLVARLGEYEFVVYNAKTHDVVSIDSQWYDFVLNSDQQWTPAVGGRHGRKLLWSLDDAE